MLLTINAQISGEDLGYLLHKNPSRLHSFDLSFGKAHVFYRKVSEQQGSASLLLDVDPVDLVRGQHSAPSGDFSLRQYVNDRPYATTSFMSVALARVFGTAMSGRSKERQDLADASLDLWATLTAVPCRGGAEFVDRLFEPLGYSVETVPHPLDASFPDWGEGPYHTIQLRGRLRLRDLLTHLYVLIPVLDAEKHYWVGQSEVEKLLSKGAGWLASHPEKDAIAHRYLAHQRSLARSALARLEDGGSAELEELSEEKTERESELEIPLQLWQQRLGAVLSALKACQARSVLDLGCGEGKLLKALMQDRSFENIVGMDVSTRSLERASDRLRLDQLAPAQKNRLKLIQGSLMYRDKRLEGFDAAAVVEVIEHLDPPRLAAFERVVFEQARPRHVVITTPNSEYNVKFETLPQGKFRHRDHRFEWTRAEFGAWADGITERFGYSVKQLPIGSEYPELGAPTQMGVFSR